MLDPACRPTGGSEKQDGSGPAPWGSALTLLRRGPVYAGSPTVIDLLPGLKEPGRVRCDADLVYQRGRLRGPRPAAQALLKSISGQARGGFNEDQSSFSGSRSDAFGGGFSRNKRGPMVMEGELVAKSTSVSEFSLDDRVFHQKFGYGHVVKIDGNKLTIAFEKAGEKKVVDSFVERV